MIDINLIRTNPDLVRANIQRKFQDHKLPLVDKALELDAKRRALISEGDALRSARNTLSKQVGMLMKAGDKDGAEKVKAQVKADADRLVAIEKEHRGKGFGTEGLRLTIIEAKKILAKYGETELYLRCNITNPASLSCMLKNGAVIHHQDEQKYYTRIKLD